MLLRPGALLTKLRPTCCILLRGGVASAMASSGAANGIGGLHALDRKAMEAERLARLARKRQVEAEPVMPVRKIARTEAQPTPSNFAPAPAPVVNMTHLKKPASSIKNPQLNNSYSQKEKLPHSLQFPDGVIRKTWAFGHERSRDIKIEEVLQKSTLNIAVLSSFMWDMPWIYSKLDPTRTKLALIMHAKDENMKAALRHDTASWPNGLRVHFPSISGGCMHSKLMLLFHPEHLRIVIPSANLVHFDWGEDGIMENTVFMIDLPRISGEAMTADSNTTLKSSFALSLLKFLDALQVDQDIKDGLLKFDFTKTAKLAFVYAASGTYSGAVASATGLNGLSEAVRSVTTGILPEEPIEVDYVTSSIGALKDNQIFSLVQAFRGHDIQERNWDGNHNKLRIYFPTLAAVESSKGGTSCGGTICLQKQWYESATFPRDKMRNCISRRTGLLSHNKIVLVRSPRIAYVYVGSANLSESAWGKRSTDRKTKQSKIYCRNWECGVLMPARLPVNEDEIETASEESATEGEDLSRSGATSGIMGIEVFKDILDIPFELPAKPYGKARPWYFMEQ